MYACTYAHTRKSDDDDNDEDDDDHCPTRGPLGNAHLQSPHANIQAYSFATKYCLKADGNLPPFVKIAWVSGSLVKRL